jgi:hypothetical protein
MASSTEAQIHLTMDEADARGMVARIIIGAVRRGGCLSRSAHGEPHYASMEPCPHHRVTEKNL